MESNSAVSGSFSELLKIGEEMEKIHKEFMQGLSAAGADMESEAALQYTITLEVEGAPEAKTTEVWRNTRAASVTPPKVGDKWSGGLYDYQVTAVVREIQPSVIEAKKVLESSRDIGQTFQTMSAADVNAFVSIPSVLGESNESVAAISQSMEMAIADVGQLIDGIDSSWSADTRALYQSLLQRYEIAFQNCQADAESVIQANIAFANICVDVMRAFLALRKAQHNSGINILDLFFKMNNPWGWIALFNKLVKELQENKKEYLNDIEVKIAELGESAEKKNIIESAGRTVGQRWPEPSGLEWSHK